MENDEKRLIEAFAVLMKKRPFDSISSGDITGAAGLPRSRFAYYFHDMYAIAEALFKVHEDTLAGAALAPEDADEAFLLTVSFATKYPDEARNICRSSGGGIYKKHVLTLASKYFSEALQSRLGKDELTEDELRRVRFLRAAAVSLASREILASDDPAAEADRYADLFTF